MTVDWKRVAAARLVVLREQKRRLAEIERYAGAAIDTALHAACFPLDASSRRMRDMAVELLMRDIGKEQCP